jgi:quercetin dioxygenase-like cupin family protein
MENIQMSRDQSQKEIKGQPFRYIDLMDYQPGTIVSRTLIDQKTGSVTLFAFDEGQKLSEHTAPFDALVEVIDGAFDVTINGHVHRVEAGTQIIMPANEPHALRAVQKSTMLLVMIRS